MKTDLKRLLSKRIIIIVLVAVLVLSVFNTYLILDGIQSANRTNVVNYDYVLSHNGDGYQLKDMLTGYVSTQSESASIAINSAMSQGKSVYINPGTYILTADVRVDNKLNAKIVSDGATINGNGKKIAIFGNDYTTSQYALVSGLTIINATIRVENSFGTTIKDTKFINSTTGIEFVNTNTWSEYNKIEDCQFINVTEGIAFRTPIGNGTGSYASSQIERSMFNLQDNSVGINVEPLAELSDSQLQDIRLWMGESDHSNQTGLRVDGAMSQTLLFGVVFESFTTSPLDMYAIDLGRNSTSPILDGGVSFLGTWTARIHNPFAVWVSAVGSVFDRENIEVPIGTNNEFGPTQVIEVRPLKIIDFKPKIGVTGNLANGQTVTVRIRIEYVDNAVSTPVTKTFTNATSYWLSDNEIMQLFPSQNVIWAVLVDAKTSASSTDASVKVSGYGIAG